MINIETPLISVVMITYGHENYIEEAIKGVFNQQTNFDVELIIANDCSPDNTDAIITEIIKEAPANIKVNYISHRVNIGMMSNSMDAFSLARGKYIAFCEGDDYWTNSLKLQKQIDFLEKNEDFSLSCHNALTIYEDVTKKSHPFNKLKKSLELEPTHIVNDWVVPTASMVFRMNIIRNLPVWFTDIYSGDYTLALLNMNKGRIHFDEEIMSVYRVVFNGTSASSIYKNEMVFVYHQHIKLLTLFNEYSNFKFEKIISKKAKKLLQEIAFLEALNKSKMHALLFEPATFIKKIFKKVIK
ncbi:glycosyltransferase family 2 protein [Pedobacter nototheniae]|uniref:glycosyltransferase family 2 protein n=1 Tax=Pedobacter nototheniae TaxID=2488994 RepID=UPI00292D1091|nr:glycosyltransferase [Pedobacter nototheniae]